MPHISIRELWLPKAGHTAEEYEDAFAASGPALPLRAAVADGATESAFSGGWARALVASYAEGFALVEAVARSRARWTPRQDERWYVEAKAAEGAHAAFLGFELEEEGWRAEAVGDCCLFHIRDGGLVKSWPYEQPDSFTNRPPLVSSRENDALPEVEHMSGTWLSDDRFVLATDAVAEWLMLAGLESILNTPGGDSMSELDVFEPWIAAARREGMRNDDATLVVISTGET